MLIDDLIKYSGSIQYSGLNLDLVYDFCLLAYGDLYITDVNKNIKRLSVGDYILYDQEAGSYLVIDAELFLRFNIWPRLYRKKPVVILALKYMGYDKETFHKYQEFCPTLLIDLDGVTWLTTLEGKMIVRPTDYIILGVLGLFYVCKLSVFKKTYTREY